MKKTITIALFALLLLIPFGDAFSADKVVFLGAYANTAEGTVNGPLFGGGYGTRLTGDFWILSYFKYGVYEDEEKTGYGTLSTELAYFPLGDSTLLGLNVRWSLGALAGANADWVPAEDGGSLTAYLDAAIGAIGTLNFGDRVGIFAFAKHKDQPLANTGFTDGLMFGGGATVAIDLGI